MAKTRTELPVNETIELTPELREAITRVFDLAEENVDRDDGLCWDDDPDMCERCKAIRAVRPLTTYPTDDDQDEDEEDDVVEN